jgi:serine/threonine-protein kinase HipA
MSRIGKVFYQTDFAGIISEDEDGYHFQYDAQYLNMANAQAISLTIPLQNKPLYSNILFPFFDGLIPEGWLMDIAIQNWKLNPRDRMGLLLAVCKDCIGAVSIITENQASI